MFNVNLYKPLSDIMATYLFVDKKNHCYKCYRLWSNNKNILQKTRRFIWHRKIVKKFPLNVFFYEVTLFNFTQFWFTNISETKTQDIPLKWTLDLNTLWQLPRSDKVLTKFLPTELQKDYFCPVSRFSTKKCPNHAFGEISWNVS